MNHYQKLGTLIFRVIAIICSSVGVLGLVYMAVINLAFGTLIQGYERWPSSCFYTLLGIVVYRFSGKIGKYVANGLE